MAVYKRKYDSGTVLWYFKFQPPAAARGSLPIRQFGFATKREAEDAEAARRVETAEIRVGKSWLRGRGGTSEDALDAVGGILPATRGEEISTEDRRTILRAGKIPNPVLLAMVLADVTPLHLNREWNRLLQNGGRTRGHKTQRPLSAKSVRSIAGVVSSAFHRAVKWGLVGVNPVSNSEPPIPKKHKGMALLPKSRCC